MLNEHVSAASCHTYHEPRRSIQTGAAFSRRNFIRVRSSIRSDSNLACYRFDNCHLGRMISADYDVAVRCQFADVTNIRTLALILFMSMNRHALDHEFAPDSEETKQLVELLRRLRATGAESPNLPRDIWQAMTALVPVAAVEVLITNDQQEFLLTMRQDQHWNGWHIPGGYVGCGEPLADACRRVAKRELGIDVQLQKILHAFTWSDHPYAQTVSIVCGCSTSEMPNCGHFFREIPAPMVPNHEQILQRFLATQ